MGVLDELKKEAEAAAADKAREEAARASALAQAREQIEPRMREAFRYFEELKQHLEAVNREIAASYEIRGVGRVNGLAQGQYRVSAADPESLDRFSFRCVCAKSGMFQVMQQDAASVAAYRDYLKDNGLKATARDSGRGALFKVESVVPVAVEFSAHYERGAIVLQTRNLTAIGVSRHTLRVEQLEPKLLDEVAKAILRSPSRFDEVVDPSITQSGKVRLKKKIRAAMRQKEIEAEMAEREAQRQETLTRRFSRTLFGRKDDS